MVDLTTIKRENVAFVQRQPLTAVFVGATNGIGEFTVRQLCATHRSGGPGLRIIIVGRNAPATQKIIDECKGESSNIEFHFVQAGDISLLCTVDKACDNTKAILETTDATQIDMLIMSQGKVEFGGRINTEEGLDNSMSLLYYSRMRFITNLLPLLLSSSLPTGAKIVSVYAAGSETWGRLYSNDLSLDETSHYTFASCRSHCVAMKTMFFEELADKHSGKLSLTHMYPGLVVHSGFDDPNYPWWFRLIWKFVKPFARFFPIYLTPEEIGQRVLFLGTDRYPAKCDKADGKPVMDGGLMYATNGVEGGGAYSITYTNEVNATEKFYKHLREDGFRESVVRHTQQVFEVVQGKGVFEPKKMR